MFSPPVARSLPENNGCAVADCPLFTKLPLEVRNIIYGHLLIVPETINRAHELVSGVQTVIAKNCHSIPGLDATILQTCRSVYDEALPILYGCNFFSFRNPDHIKKFKSEGLGDFGQELSNLLSAQQVVVSVADKSQLSISSMPLMAA